MAKVNLTRGWFAPDGVFRRKGDHEVPEDWVKEDAKVLPKSAKVLPSADPPKKEPAVKK